MTLAAGMLTFPGPTHPKPDRFHDLRVRLLAFVALLLSACDNGAGGASSAEAERAAAVNAAAVAMPVPLARALHAQAFVPVVSRQDGEALELLYRATDAELLVRRIACPMAGCGDFGAAVDPMLARLLPPDGGGFEFLHVSSEQLELRAVAAEGVMRLHAFELPGEVQVWRVRGHSDERHAAFRDGLGAALAEAAAVLTAPPDGRPIGRFGPLLAAHAARLERENQPAQALAIYRRIVAARPDDYPARARLAELSTDAQEVWDALWGILNGAEDPELAAMAERRLGIGPMPLEQVPPLEARARGLVVKLVIDPPVDLRLVHQASALYTQATGIPVHVRRFAEPFPWRGDSRPRYARDVQRALRGQSVGTWEFQDWTLERYQRALLERAEQPGISALARFALRDWAAVLARRPMEYDVTPMLEAFGRFMWPNRSDDRRTMYVMVTARPIYGEEFRYVFNRSMDPPFESPVAVMSYAELMDAEAPDRQRLVERLAKEMVPATLKQLAIPRPTDPADPYSQSGGLDDTDRKTLSLSPPTRAALQRLMAVP